MPKPIEKPSNASPELGAGSGARRSLTHVGGQVELRGDPVAGAILRHALEVDSASDEQGEAAARAHVHGFHSYPARMHPDTAARLVTGLSAPRATVLDPFAGSGTVLIEAALANRRALGTDLNPLAVRLAQRKLAPAAQDERDALVENARRIAEIATARRKAKAGASRRYPREDVDAFDPHVLLELDSLRGAIAATPQKGWRSTLELVLSSILVKLSRKRGDTASGTRPMRIAAGFPAKLFVKKTEELCRSLAEIEARVRAAPRAAAWCEDARELPHIEPRSVDLVVTSPPYPGVYDYVEHHRLRMRWLGLGERTFEAREIGARRELGALDAAAATRVFEQQMGDVLAALARVLVPHGRAVFVVADGAHGRHALRTDALLERAASARGFSLVAIASQARPHFHARSQSAFTREPRREHAILWQLS